jgi:FAD dependent oxidoreductase TIGR03364
MTAPPIASSDLLVVGAGVVGLAHAAAAIRKGLSVTVIDRDRRAVGASVRNFGHCCITAQSGELLDFARVARERWLDYANASGIFSVRSGAVAVARSSAELAVLEQLSDSRDGDEVSMLSSSDVAVRLGGGGSGIVGGAMLRSDVRVDPREAVSGIAGWLEARRDVRFLWGTSYLGYESGTAITSRGNVRADRVIVCVGHDLDYLFPDEAAEHGILRCSLQMALLDAPLDLRVAEAVLTGTSMLRYPAFSETDASAALRAEMREQNPDLLDIDANVMFTQRPDGTILAGDSHRVDETMDPFLDERTSERLLDEIAAVIGRRLTVRQRWQGIYASSAKAPYLVAKPQDDVTAVSVTSGVGMTISFGLAERVLADF